MVVFCCFFLLSRLGMASLEPTKWHWNFDLTIWIFETVTKKFKFNYRIIVNRNAFRNFRLLLFSKAIRMR